MADWDAWQILIVGIVLLLINVVLIAIDMRFWRRFLGDHGKRHKRGRTNR